MQAPGRNTQPGNSTRGRRASIGAGQQDIDGGHVADDDVHRLQALAVATGARQHAVEELPGTLVVHSQQGITGAISGVAPQVAVPLIAPLLCLDRLNPQLDFILRSSHYAVQSTCDSDKP